MRKALADTSVRINGLQAKLLFVQDGLREMMVLACSHETSRAVVGARAAGADLHDALVFLDVKRNDMRAEIGQNPMPVPTSARKAPPRFAQYTTVAARRSH